MLAWLLRGVLFAILCGSALAGGAAWHRGWQWSGVVGLALVAPLLPAAILGIEFVLLARFGRDAQQPAPTPAQLWRAWLAEARASTIVFGWRQAFAANLTPDSAGAPGRRGVVLVHGYVCNRGLWRPWLDRLRAAHIPAIAVTLEPVFASIDAMTSALDAAVSRSQRETGLPPLVVAHSMGGLVVRAWLRATAGDRCIAGVITIGSPHAGTWLARFSRTVNGRQMRRGSAWLTALAASEPADRRARFTCFYSDCDNIVFPASTGCLQGADNRLIKGVPHIALADHHAVFAEVRDRLCDGAATVPIEDHIRR